MAAVRVEDEAFGDRRYETLAKRAGLADADHARGKMLVLWRQCTIEQRHILTAEEVEDVLGVSGSEALIAARLGEQTADGIRIKGTRGRIEWLKKLRDNGKFGKRGGRPKKNPPGLSSPNPRGFDSETPLALALALALAPSPAQKKKTGPTAPLDLTFQEPETEKTPPPKASWQPVIDLHWELFEKRFQSKPSFVTAYPARLKAALKCQPIDELLKRLRVFHAKPPGTFPDGYDLGTFLTHLDRFVGGPIGVAPAPAYQRPTYGEVVPKFTDIDVEEIRGPR